MREKSAHACRVQEHTSSSIPIAEAAELSTGSQHGVASSLLLCNAWVCCIVKGIGLHKVAVT